MHSRSSGKKWGLWPNPSGETALTSLPSHLGSEHTPGTECVGPQHAGSLHCFPRLNMPFPRSVCTGAPSVWLCGTWQWCSFGHSLGHRAIAKSFISQRRWWRGRRLGRPGSGCTWGPGSSLLCLSPTALVSSSCGGGCSPLCSDSLAAWGECLGPLVALVQPSGTWAPELLVPREQSYSELLGFGVTAELLGVLGIPVKEDG